jgi:hypothetical protein
MRKIFRISPWAPFGALPNRPSGMPIAWQPVRLAASVRPPDVALQPALPEDMACSAA